MSSSALRDAPTQPGDDTQRAPATHTAPSEGDLIDGRFRLVAHLDRGGMGDVFRAEHVALRRPVALKLMRPEFGDDPAVAMRFLREARALQSVRHPHVVAVHDCGHHRGRPYLAMELLTGETLRARLDRDGPLAPAEALALLGPLADALAAVHDAGFVHRDVKPHNVMLHREGESTRAVLLDFGIARSDDGLALTELGDTPGTPAYMSPEQARGDRAISAASDQYSLAVVLYEALTGDLPHDAATRGALYAARIHDAPVPITHRRRDLPAPFARAVMRALATDPARRFPSVRAFARALDAPSSPRPVLFAAVSAVALLALALHTASAARPAPPSQTPSAAPATPSEIRPVVSLPTARPAARTAPLRPVTVSPQVHPPIAAPPAPMPRATAPRALRMNLIRELP